MAFTMDVGQFLINQLAGEPSQLWTLPQMDGYTPVNIAESPPQHHSPPLGNPGPTAWQRGRNAPRTGLYHPQYRGYTTR